MAESHDPETGEVFEERAADGTRRHPAASVLSDLIKMLKDGQFDADSAEPLREFASKLEAVGMDTDRKAKGTITLKIEVDFYPHVKCENDPARFGSTSEASEQPRSIWIDQ